MNIMTIDDILEWIRIKNDEANVDIRESRLSDDSFWFYDLTNGKIINRKNSFFSICGAEFYKNDKFILEQPLIVQPEIGYLGIICKKFDNQWKFLLQAKIEPGNVNCVQLSPTIQATKSNFMRAHGGNLPQFFEFFESSTPYSVVFDQIEPEQTQRFYKKYNRNIILSTDKEIEVPDNFIWLTLDQILKLYKYNNIINMDTRTVLSGLPSDFYNDLQDSDIKWLNSLHSKEYDIELKKIYHFINNNKMFYTYKTILKPLYQLRNWSISDTEIRNINGYDFTVKYFNINIAGREVHNWSQPLFCSNGKGLFCLFVKRFNDEYKILVSIRNDIGSDSYQLAPSIQMECNELKNVKNVLLDLFNKNVECDDNILVDTILSEEGGRFYHEQNRNVILKIDDDFDLPKNYFWVSLKTIKYLIKSSMIVNIQLRNLISMLDLSTV